MGVDEERWPDRAVADLAGDRHCAEQGGEECSEDLSPRKQDRELLGGAGKVLGREAEAVEQHYEQDEGEQATEQTHVVGR